MFEIIADNLFLTPRILELGGKGGCIVLFYFLVLQMVTAAMKLKDAYSLEEKLWPT